jgi:hypothetical protein
LVTIIEQWREYCIDLDGVRMGDNVEVVFKRDSLEGIIDQLDDNIIRVRAMKTSRFARYIE